MFNHPDDNEGRVFSGLNVDYEETNDFDSPLPLLIVSAVIAAAVLLMVCSWPGTAHANEIPKTRAVNAIIGEAEGEPYRGKLAVACAIRNRGTLKGVYGENSKRVHEHLYAHGVFVASVKAWEESSNPENCSFIDGAKFWEGTAFKDPFWSDGMKITVVIGHQRFFRPFKESEEQEMIDRRHGL